MCNVIHKCTREIREEDTFSCVRTGKTNRDVSPTEIETCLEGIVFHFFGEFSNVHKAKRVEKRLSNHSIHVVDDNEFVYSSGGGNYLIHVISRPHTLIVYGDLGNYIFRFGQETGLDFALVSFASPSYFWGKCVTTGEKYDPESMKMGCMNEMLRNGLWKLDELGIDAERGIRNVLGDDFSIGNPDSMSVEKFREWISTPKQEAWFSRFLEWILLLSLRDLASDVVIQKSLFFNPIYYDVRPKTTVDEGIDTIQEYGILQLFDEFPWYSEYETYRDVIIMILKQDYEFLEYTWSEAGVMGFYYTFIQFMLDLMNSDILERDEVNIRIRN